MPGFQDGLFYCPNLIGGNMWYETRDATTAALLSILGHEVKSVIEFGQKEWRIKASPQMYKDKTDAEAGKMTVNYKTLKDAMRRVKMLQPEII